MASLSRFQTLPTLVVDMIIEYLMGHSRASSSFKQILSGDCEYYSERICLAELTAVSKVWRSVALSLICETCAISDSDWEYDIEVSFPAWEFDSSKLLPHTTHLVKRALSTIRYYSIDPKSVIEAQPRPGYETLSFPSATTFNLVLEGLGYYSREGYSRGETSSVGFTSDVLVRLALSHFRFAPAAVNIGLHAPAWHRPKSGAERLCDVIVSELCKGRAKSLRVSSRSHGDIVSLELHSAPELTTIMSGPNNDYTSFAMLAYLNSRSLTSLVTRMHKERDWLDLIYGDTKVPAVFSRLKRLSLYITKADYNGTWAGVKGVEMFPNLSSLEVTGAYLFVDDLLFRGNGATLQILHVPFKLVATNILGELGILDRKGVTRMRRIRFAKVTESDREHIKANGREVIARQLYRVMDVTTSLYLSCDGPDYKMYREMIITPCVSSIQHLNVGKPIYQHNHVIRVIRALPNLVSFTATIGNYERLGDDTECCRKAEDLYREFYPLGSAFRILRVLSTLWYTGYQIAEEVIRIAIVCPKPLLVYVPSDKEELFKTAVSEAIASEEFAPYADSLRHLI
ncbi:hypothetical protein GGI03_001313 [Coemansia sp. RSA 2337]|nr:hypothetical protein GGI14_004560 [Coemansia sp. S680]KAJ2074996.1 hypothetical protein GGH13_000929 [Coemansia sp. S155-1]KAJ2116439.1 hypothetical protein IW146_001530 [Coemansia sp. RSA 922]KAJ2467895.1 hypothetical protein GGI03_001313 [Coemansia sp. RSA 2337]